MENRKYVFELVFLLHKMRALKSVENLFFFYIIELLNILKYVAI